VDGTKHQTRSTKNNNHMISDTKQQKS